MKTNMILTMSVIAVLTVACSKSDDEAAKTATESMADKASNAVTEMKDTSGMVISARISLSVLMLTSGSKLI